MVAHIDRITKKTNGIICDLCGRIDVDKFEYFSAKFDLVEVDRSLGLSGIKSVDKRNLDLDICKTCMDSLKQKVVDGIKKREKGDAWSTSSKQEHKK